MVGRSNTVVVLSGVRCHRSRCWLQRIRSSSDARTPDADGEWQFGSRHPFAVNGTESDLDSLSYYDAADRHGDIHSHLHSDSYPFAYSDIDAEPNCYADRHAGANGDGCGRLGQHHGHSE